MTEVQKRWKEMKYNTIMKTGEVLVMQMLIAAAFPHQVIEIVGDERAGNPTWKGMPEGWPKHSVVKIRGMKATQMAEMKATLSMMEFRP